MEVSAKTLREVEFREKMRGYHPEDVDHFLEEVATGIDGLQDRLRQVTERAQRAEAAANEAGSADDTLRRTLVLAQRTADMAVQEARDQAARILASAEQQAQTIIVEADERAKRTLEDSLAESRAELNRMEGVRAQAQQDVDTLQRWVDEHKGHLQAALAEAVAAVERAGIMWPAPSTRPIDTGGNPPVQVRRPVPPEEILLGGEVDPGPETGVWVPTEEDRYELRQPPTAQPPSAQPPSAQVPSDRPLSAESLSVEPPSAQSLSVESLSVESPSVEAADPGSPAPAGDLFPDSTVDPEEQALDDFFDDNGEYGDDRRFSGRLRRRR
jgi:DivIVA domain-containing protein